MSKGATADKTTGKARTKFFTDIGFTKSAESKSGDLELVGYASTWVEDRDLERVAPSAFDDTLEAYLEKNPIVLWQHDAGQPIGQITEAEVDEGGLKVKAVIHKPESGEERWAHTAYHKIRRGVAKTFSIGGFFERANRTAENIIEKVDLFEISVVSIPSNPDSMFAAAMKALNLPEDATDIGSDGVTPAVVKQMEQVLGAKQITDAELAHMDDEAKSVRYDELAAAYVKSGVVPPAYDEWEKVQEVVAEKPTLEALDAVAKFMDRLYGIRRPDAADVKAGRVLSKRNEDALAGVAERLKQSAVEVDTILAQVRRTAEDEGEAEE